MRLGPLGGVEIFRKRRQLLAEKLGDGVGILTSAPEQIRNDDVHQSYRPDSSLYYLTGFEEPESVAVFAPKTDTPFIMFVRRKDATRELWDGFRYGIEGTKEKYGVDKVYPIDELTTVLPDILKTASKVFYRIGEHHEWDGKIMTCLDTAKKARGRSGAGLPALEDFKTLIGQMRLFKSSDEASLLKKACEISAKGHIKAMQTSKPGMFEYQVQAEIEREFKYLGSPRLGYGSIVATGANATVLHYVFNDDQLKDGDLLLLDAGAEYGMMSGDITRTYPVNGKFSAAQKKIYEVVLAAQKACIQMVKPGATLEQIHNKAVAVLVDGMLDLKLISNSERSKVLDEKLFRKYYPHNTSHWLGMDVHDAGFYQINGKSRPLEPGMCFTIEPGLYVPKDDSSELRGIGIRIEDDILVTKDGCEVMTSLVPKEVSEIEKLMGG